MGAEALSHTWLIGQGPVQGGGVERLVPSPWPPLATARRNQWTTFSGSFHKQNQKILNVLKLLKRLDLSIYFVLFEKIENNVSSLAHTLTGLLLKTLNRLL